MTNNSGIKKQKMDIDDLSELKMQMRHRINIQKEKMDYSAKKMFTAPSASMLGTATNIITSLAGITLRSKKMNQGFSIINGAILGYKLVKNIRYFLRKR
ncbi:MAG: hypothetical protein QM751_16070 [Paludibacteraceae bacterium]